MKTSILRNPPLTLADAKDHAARLARNMHIPAHVVLEDNGDYCVCDDNDVWGWRLEQVVWTVVPEDVYENCED